MIEYHGDCVALGDFVSALSAANFADPSVASAQGDALTSVADEPGSALLGAFVQHLVAHASSDGSELDLLSRAADLWGRGSALCDRLGQIRADLEGAMENPADAGASDRFNAAAFGAQELANSVAEMRLEVDGLRSDALSFRHLPPHPRQDDRRTDVWDWGNLQLARRTDALVRALFRGAGDPRSLSFAVGVAAAYGANVAGSAYLGHTVGGPRRSHRYRDRVARNTVGRWLSVHHPAALPLATMADRIRFGPAGAPELPADLESLLGDALGNTFDVSRTAPIPDLQVGYQRLVEHLTLLDGFELPAVPAPPSQVWMAALWADPANPPPSLRPEDIDVVGQDGGGVAAQYGPDGTGSSSPDGSDSSKTAKGCGILLLVIILIDVIQAFIQCIGQWANHHKCTFWQNMLLSKLWEQDPPDPRDPTNPNVSQSQLTTIASAPQTKELVGVLFDAHAQAWEAMDRARSFLSVTGLIYPSEITSLPLYAQFTAVPAKKAWPHREEASPESTYHLYPASAIEHPDAVASPYPFGSAPDVFLSAGAQLHAATVTLGLWGQIAAGEADSQNLDLDADRGARHLCWAARGSVHDEPIDVVVLGYDQQ